LTQKFKESAGGDDMASSPSSLSSMDDDLDIDYSLQPNKESSIESLVQKTYQTRVNSGTSSFQNIYYKKQNTLIC
jgi:hypothetical protein